MSCSVSDNYEFFILFSVEVLYKPSSLCYIYTSHSPTLVSRIGIDKIALLYENNHRINCLSFSESNLEGKDKYYLERYLDVTKSQMLFAKGILFVEGISEALTKRISYRN